MKELLDALDAWRAEGIEVGRAVVVDVLVSSAHPFDWRIRANLADAFEGSDLPFRAGLAAPPNPPDVPDGFDVPAGRFNYFRQFHH